MQYFYRSIAYVIATGCGIGHAPFAPGSWASCVTAVILFWLCPDWQAIGLMTLVLVPIGVWASSIVENQSRCTDPSYIVIDEVIGMSFTLLAAPKVWWAYASAFVLFRFFDIVKPFPIRSIEKIFSGGLGIVFDDVMAAVYASLCLVLIKYLMSL